MSESARSRRQHITKTRLFLEHLERREVPSGTTLGPLVQVGPSTTPFTNTNDIPGQSGTVFLNSEVEPRCSVDPTNPLHMVAVWQQDRWSNGGSRGIVYGVTTDGGNTWTVAPLPNITVNDGGPNLRASDPWVSIASNSTTVYAASLPDNDPSVQNPHQMYVSRSLDGGNTWGSPLALINDTSNNFFNDKESVTADPVHTSNAYFVWDRLDFTQNTGPAYFSRTIDGGNTWETARSIFDGGSGTQTVGNQIIVLPSGTVLDFFTEDDSSGSHAEVIRSTDQGVTWSSPTIISNITASGITDPDNGQGVRAGATLLDVAVNHTNGNLYVTWEDGRFSGFTHDDIAMSTSTDGGLTWSTPFKVNRTPTTIPAVDQQAFTPSVAVDANGTVAVTYYDFRFNNPKPGASTDYWMVRANPGKGGGIGPGSFGGEQRLTTHSFNLELAPNAEGLFLGDYESLVAGGASANSFGAFFVQAVSSSEPSGTYFRDPGTAITPPKGADFAVSEQHAPTASTNQAGQTLDAAALDLSFATTGQNNDSSASWSPATPLVHERTADAAILRDGWQWGGVLGVLPREWD
jgi:hypothetical protein